MNQLFITYIISFWLISHNTIGTSSNFRFTPPNRNAVHLVKELEKKFRRPELARLIGGFAFGLKRSIDKKVKAPFKKLNLQHLFTPSGLHLSSVFLILGPLFFLFKRKYKFKIKKSVELCISFVPFFLGPYYSLQRIASLRLGSFLLKRYGLSPYIIFILVFGLDFLFGTYSKSPLSFSYSFLFLGILIALWDKGKIQLIAGLAGGQLIISLIQFEYFYPNAPILNFFLSSLFTFLFPVLAIGLILKGFPSPAFYESICGWYLSIVERSSELLSSQFALSPSFIFFLILILLSLSGPKKWHLILLLLVPGSLLNSPLDNYQKELFGKYKSDQIFASPLKRVVRTAFGEIVYFKNGGKCVHQILNTRYDKRCRLKR